MDRMFPWNYCRGRNSSGTFCRNFLKLNGLQFHLITSLPISHKLSGWKLSEIVLKPKRVQYFEKIFPKKYLLLQSNTMKTWHLMWGVAQLCYAIQSFLLTQTIMVQLRFTCLKLIFFFFLIKCIWYDFLQSLVAVASSKAFSIFCLIQLPCPVMLRHTELPS